MMLRAALQRCWSVRWVRFVVVGVLNTAVSYLAYCLLLALGANYALANLGALALGILFSFRTQSALVFRHDGKGRFGRFLATWLALYGLNVAMIAGLLRCGLNPYAAGALALPPMVILSFFAQRGFVFGRRGRDERSGGGGPLL